uniref:Uncharacterized protein n=1 Tax=Romanomermis culicivorax TaxID=13658 RepID=A0A915IVV2_ROMCU
VLLSLIAIGKGLPSKNLDKWRPATSNPEGEYEYDDSSPDVDDENEDNNDEVIESDDADVNREPTTPSDAWSNNGKK